jgi:hypothetical protein
MSKRVVFALAATLALYVVSVPAAPSYFPVSEIKAGMRGTGLTVWGGSRVEEFTVHVLGVVRNVIGPRRDLILARLEGGPLADTGVIAGMSGSPVYFEGRLAGAVSYSLGAFSKEAIAGITPIAEMTEAALLEGSRPAMPVKAQLELPVTRESMIAAFRASFSWFRPFADRASDVEVLNGVSGSLVSSQLGTLLRPIATPLAISGFRPEIVDLLGSGFQEYGFIPTAGAAAVDTVTAATPVLKPGDAVGISLISGDLSLGAIGTVTAVDGNRVYAFGHPFYNLGPVQFPMTQAYVHALLPSLTTSTKLATTGEMIGTIQQDRATTVAGVLGKLPALIPMKISLISDRGFEKTFTFQVVSDQLFTPLLTYLGILNTLGSYEREAGAASFTVKGKVTVKQHDDIAFEDLFTGDQPSVGAATYVAAPITFLLRNDFEPVEIEGLDLTITSTEQPRTATIERVWLDDPRPRAGKTVPLKVLMRTYRGEEVVRTVAVDIPPNANGTLSIMVSDGSRLAQWERREARQPAPPRGVPQMIRALNNARKNNRLYVRLLGVDAGAVINGESLSGLPPSVLEVIEGDRNSGEFVPLRNTTLGEWDVLTDYAVVGSRLLTVNIGSD